MNHLAPYQPTNEFEVRVHDTVYRRDQEEPLAARIYQPQGTGPFPALLDVHGGVWNERNLSDNEHMDRALAASGMVVAAIDYRLAPRHPYPAQVADINFGIRWLKAHAEELNADPRTVGALGASSGGPTVMLSAMRPHDPRYAALPLPSGDDVDATLLYVLAAWPVLDPYARYLFAQETNNERLAAFSEAYFLSQEVMKEGNPQHILERGESAHLPATLIVQGTSDNNVPMSIPERFSASYSAAGGEVQLEVFPNMPHGFGNTPGAETDRALAIMKGFVARQLAGIATTV